MYNRYPEYYKAYFGTEKPSRKLVITYLQYSEDTYMEEMKKDATDAVKSEMAFWYLIQLDNVTLTEEEIAERREEYIDLYGEAVFDGISDRMIREQFLRDKFLSQLIDELKEKGNITYTTAE